MCCHPSVYMLKKIHSTKPTVYTFNYCWDKNNKSNNFAQFKLHMNYIKPSKTQRFC